MKYYYLEIYSKLGDYAFNVAAESKECVESKFLEYLSKEDYDKDFFDMDTLYIGHEIGRNDVIMIKEPQV